MTAANGTHPVLPSAHAASQQLRPMTSARAAGLRKAPQQDGNEGDHCTHASQRGLSQTVTRMPEFLERQSAVDNRRLPPAPGTKQNTADLARVVIDAMAVAGCRGWNCDIAWQTARELLPSTPEARLAAIIERVQWALCAA